MVRPGNTTITPGALTVFEVPARTRLDKLPDGHPALEFLEQRELDVNRVTMFAVGYSDGCEESQPKIYEPSLIIPFLKLAPNGDCLTVGWQARRLRCDADSNAPKYLTSTGCRKSEVLYAHLQVSKVPGPLVVVEGVTDVWRIGASAVAILGHCASPSQVNQLAHLSRIRPIIVSTAGNAPTARRQPAKALCRHRSSAGQQSR